MQWNIFRYLADFSHLFSVIILLYKMITKKSCSGVSLKTQYMYLIVFISRYVNSYLFDRNNMYNTIFKFIYIFSTLAVIILMKFPFNRTYEDRHDNLRISIFIIPCAIVAYFAAPYKTWENRMWTFSLFVEIFAILPQIFFFARSKKTNILDSDYVFLLAIYRFFYLLNWIYKAVTDTGSTPIVVWVAGILQVLMYGDFIFIYIKNRIQKRDSLDMIAEN